MYKARWLLFQHHLLPLLQLAHGFELTTGGHDIFTTGFANGASDAGRNEDATEGAIAIACGCK